MTTTAATQTATTQPQSSFTITQRLRERLGVSGGSSGANHKGLGDPFAEIFARMTVSTPPPETASAPVPPPPVQSDDPPGDDDSVDESADTTDPNASAAAVAVPVVDAAPADHQSPDTEIDPAGGKTAATSQSETGDDEPATEQAEAVLTPTDGAESVAGVRQDEPTSELAQPETETPDSSATTVVVDSEIQGTIEQVVAPEIELTVATPAAVNVKTDGDNPVNAAGSTETEPDDPSPVVAAASDRRTVDRRRYSQTDGKPDSRSNVTGDVPPGVADGEPAGQPNPDALRRAAFGRDAAASAAPDTTFVATSAGGGAVVDPGAAAASPVSSLGVAAASAVRAASSSSGSGGNAGGNPGQSGPSSPTPIDTAARSSGNAGSESAAASASTGSGADQLSAVQRARLVQRVSRSFQQIGRDGGQIRLRLSPDQLGSLQLDLRLESGVMRGRMVAESEAAGQVLREHLPELRANLASQGIRLDQIEIEVDPSGGLDTPGEFSLEGRSGENRGSGDRPTPHAERRENLRETPRPVTPVAVRSLSPGVGGGIDVRL